MTHLPPDRAWRTWDYRYPGCFMHLPSRFAIKASLYSGKENRYENFECEHQSTYELGEQTSDSSYARLILRSAGTVLGLEVVKDGHAGLVGRLRVVEAGEMLFRLLLVVEAGFLEPHGQDESLLRAVELERFGEGEQFRMPSIATAAWRSQQFCLAVDPAPTAANLYDHLDEVEGDLTERGWLYRPEPNERGSWAVFRFPGNPKVDVTFAVAQRTDAPTAREHALRSLTDARTTIEAAAADAAGGDEATRAIRDVMAWNTVWDDANARPYTCLSRAWIRHLGGWGIWLSDILYNALLCARAGDNYMARENLRAVFTGQQPAGNLPCLLAGYEEWVDRTQLPVAAYVTWRVYLLTEDKTLLEESYATLRRHYAWVTATRDGNGNGLFEYGSSPTGVAHNTHAKQGAMNESGMDNMPIFDDTVFNPEANTLEFEEPGHNSLLALEFEFLGRMARELGRATEADELEAASEALREKIRTLLWDPEREIFAGRHWSGAFASQLSPTSFFPLVAGAATPEQCAALIQKHLLNEQEFWGPLPLPSTPFDDPVSRENSYWRGRIWPPLNYFTWEGLRRYGENAVATELAERSWQMFKAEWDGARHCHENFHISDPTLHDSPDSDPFYSWGALIPLMAASESADVSPWDGLVLGQDAELVLPGRRWSTHVDENGLVVSLNGNELARISGTDRVRGLSFDNRRLCFRVTIDAPARTVAILAGRERKIVTTRVDGVIVDMRPNEHGVPTIDMPSAGDVEVDVVFARAIDA